MWYLWPFSFTMSVKTISRSHIQWAFWDSWIIFATWASCHWSSSTSSFAPGASWSSFTPLASQPSLFGMSSPSTLGLWTDGPFRACFGGFAVTSFQGCFWHFFDTGLDRLIDPSDADDSIGNAPSEVLSLVGPHGILRRFVCIPNLANALMISWHTCLLASDAFFLDEDMALFLAAGFPCARASRGLVHVTGFLICFGLIESASVRSTEGKSSSRLAWRQKKFAPVSEGLCQSPSRDGARR